MPHVGAMGLLRTDRITVREADRNKDAIRFRKEWFGDAPEQIEVLCAGLKLLEDLGESIPFHGMDASNFRANEIKNGIEEVLHELAHHVSLESSAGREVKFEERRASIAMAISDLTPGMQHGNELDAIAISLEAMWWLHCPHKQMQLAAGAREGGAWFVGIGARSINNIVTDLRGAADNAELGAWLALAIYEEIERQRREGRWVRKK